MLSIDPTDHDDLAYVNSLYEKGWNTDTEVPIPSDGGLRMYLHLSFCDGCAANRQEADPDNDFVDDDDYEKEKQRRLRELDKKYPPPPDDDKMPF